MYKTKYTWINSLRNGIKNFTCKYEKGHLTPSCSNPINYILCFTHTSINIIILFILLCKHLSHPITVDWPCLCSSIHATDTHRNTQQHIRTLHTPAGHRVSVDPYMQQIRIVTHSNTYARFTPRQDIVFRLQRAMKNIEWQFYLRCSADALDAVAGVGMWVCKSELITFTEFTCI